jgi:hypothetical protein
MTQEQLSSFVFKMKEQVMQFTNRMVTSEAAHSVPACKDKTSTAWEHIVHFITKHIGLTHSVAIHSAPKQLKETEDKLQDFIAMMKDRITDRNKDDILNMDQTPLILFMLSKDWKQSEQTPSRYIQHSTKIDMKCVTLAAIIIASGEL